MRRKMIMMLRVTARINEEERNASGKAESARMYPSR